MKVRVGRFYDNRTKRYLLPIVSDYGDTAVKHLNSIFKLGVGINDAIIPDHLRLDKHLFLLIDINVVTPTFKKVLKWLKQQTYFEKDYSYDDIIDGHMHMIVLRIPEKHYSTYENFINDKFSKMFTNEEIKRYFRKDDVRVRVLVKDEELLKHFVDKVNKTFDTEFTYEEWDGEIDFPCKKNEEIFNYSLIYNQYGKRRNREKNNGGQNKVTTAVHREKRT